MQCRNSIDGISLESSWFENGLICFLKRRKDCVLRAVGAEKAGLTVEDELVIRTDGVAVGERGVQVSGYLCEHLYSAHGFAALKRGCAEVDEKIDSAFFQRGDGVAMVQVAWEIVWAPDVLTDGEAEGEGLSGEPELHG
jgi:hypothetical protein